MYPVISMGRKSKKKYTYDYIKWCAIFGIFASFIAGGVFWMFDIMYHSITERAAEVSAQISSATAYGIYNQDQLPQYQPQFPALGYAALFLIGFGIAGFLVTKYYYEKSKK